MVYPHTWSYEHTDEAKGIGNFEASAMVIFDQTELAELR